jgi:hypothetical protein
MNITDKIEEIRRKPEYERIRYVWGMVLVSMVFVIFIWFFSFKSIFKSESRTNSEVGPITGLDENKINANNNNLEIEANLETNKDSNL